MGLVAAEFGCGPIQARRELDADADLVFEIMRLRAYASAKQTYTSAKPEEQQQLVFGNPLIKLVQEFEYERAGQRLTAARARQTRG